MKYYDSLFTDKSIQNFRNWSKCLYLLILIMPFLKSDSVWFSHVRSEKKKEKMYSQVEIINSVPKIKISNS